MKRGGQLRRRAALHASRLRSVSVKRAAVNRGTRAGLNAALKDTVTPCAVRFDGCTGRATSWHERRKRSAGGSIVDPANLVAACIHCNDAIEDHPTQARAAGWVAREGDPDWDALSKRHDRPGGR